MDVPPRDPLRPRSIHGVVTVALLVLTAIGCRPAVQPGDRAATVSWIAPDGEGHVITGYVVTPYIGDVAQPARTFDSTATTQTVTDLVNGTTYTFRVTPRRDCTGSCAFGTPSEPSLPVTVGAPIAPGDLTASTGSTTAEVGWSAPVDNGSPITGYVVTPFAGSVAGVSQLTGPEATSATVTGLTNGTIYTFQVAARNDRGTGPAATTGPVVVGGAITAISLGYRHSCVLRHDGTVACWGWNVGGQLGDGSFVDRSLPVAVAGLTGVIAISGGDYHTCALRSNRTVACWGANWSGQLGIGRGPTESSTPVTVPGLNHVTAIAAGATHTCAQLADATVRCWGENSEGELGDGTTTSRYLPVAVRSLRDVQAVTAGQQHTCALLIDGTVRCWGDNHYGAIGDGTVVSRAKPVVVQGLSDVTAIATGDHYTCALLASGTERCWGWGVFGELGDGTDSTRLTPVSVHGLTNIVAIVVGGYHSCALLPDRTEQCWGWLPGNTSNPGIAAPVAGLTGGVELMAAGGYHSCALLLAGTLMCWGENANGQLGDGTQESRMTPMPVHGL